MPRRAMLAAAGGRFAGGGRLIPKFPAPGSRYPLPRAFYTPRRAGCQKEQFVAPWPTGRSTIGRT